METTCQRNRKFSWSKGDRAPIVAFTLIELLVVIAVIGLLAALMLPALKLIRGDGRKSQCANNLRQLGMGIIQYANFNNGVLPGSTGTLSWDDVIVNYESPGAAMRFPVLRCPEDNRSLVSGASGPRSYVISKISGNNGFLSGSSSGSRLLLDATFPEDTILLTEYWTNSAGVVTATTVQGNYASSCNGYTSTIPKYPNDTSRYYHNQVINYLMADGGLQAIKPSNFGYWKVIR